MSFSLQDIYASDYFSEQCSRCRWGGWRSGCLNMSVPVETILYTMDAAKGGHCPSFEAGSPQPEQPPPVEWIYISKEAYDKLTVERDGLLREVESLRTEVARMRAEFSVA